MDIRILRYFLTVAKEQNFTKAAEQLNITQPTLSRQLAAFEEGYDGMIYCAIILSILFLLSGIMSSSVLLIIASVLFDKILYRSFCVNSLCV